jgi:acyl-CoA reductase-like NAD-dependent aldehyde dehydrogenase
MTPIERRNALIARIQKLIEDRKAELAAIAKLEGYQRPRLRIRDKALIAYLATA